MKGEVVLITGCSTGIGRDLAQRLSREGCAVVATARKIDALASLEAALKLPLDVTEPASVEQAVRETLSALGRIDVLVNNAGISVRGAVEEVDEGLARSMFDVNVWGLLRVTRAVLPAMRERRRGRIINIGSVVGRLTWPINGAYAASKHAVEALTDALRLELYPFGISVVLVEPGTTDTNFLAASEARGAAVTRDPSSPYAPLYGQFQRLALDPARAGAKAERVSRVVLRAMAARRPRARYLAAVATLYRLILAGGDGTRDWILRRVFRIAGPDDPDRQPACPAIVASRRCHHAACEGDHGGVPDPRGPGPSRRA